MRYLAFPALVLLISCGSSEKNLSDSTTDSLTADSILYASSKSDQTTDVLTADQVKNFTPDSLFSILAQRQLITGSFRSGAILTKSFLKIGLLDAPGNLLTVYLESESDENVSNNNSDAPGNNAEPNYDVMAYLAVFEMTQPLKLVAQLEVGQYSSSDQKRSVSASLETFSSEQATVAILTSYKSEFDVISQEAYDRIVYYALDAKEIVPIFEYSAMEYTFQGADGWISTTTTGELKKGEFVKGTLCTLEVTYTSVDESSDPDPNEESGESSEGEEVGEAQPSEESEAEDSGPLVKKYKFNGKKYVEV